ncbi:MAG: M20/M25/M40 family metallo-hydrolase [Longimicrobiaceae bacterium]
MTVCLKPQCHLVILVLLALLAGCAPPPPAAPQPAAQPVAAAPMGEEDEFTPAEVEPRYIAEVQRIARRPEVERAFRVVEQLEERTTRDLIMLTEIAAPPFMEEERARKYLEMLVEAGVDTAYIDAEGNAIGIRRGVASGHTLVLSGHLDTVFPEGTDVTVRTRGDTLFAPGIGDDTRGLIVVLTVLRAMNAANIQTQGDVWFVGTVGEEGLGDLRGVKHLFREGGPRIDAFISVDGGGDSRIVNRGLGSRRYRVTYRGPGGHSWGAFGMANPAHALGRAVTAFDREAGAYAANGVRTSYNVGRIGGGTSVNAIPFESWMEVDMRSESQPRLSGIDEIFRRVVQQALDEQNRQRRFGDPLTVDMDLVGDRPSGEIPPGNPFVQRAMASVRFFDIEPALGVGSTDANIPIALGIPAVTVGRGGEGGGAHSLDEWWLNRDGHIAIQRTLLLVLAEAGLAGGGQ